MRATGARIWMRGWRTDGDKPGRAQCPPLCVCMRWLRLRGGLGVGVDRGRAGAAIRAERVGGGDEAGIAYFQVPRRAARIGHQGVGVRAGRGAEDPRGIGANPGAADGGLVRHLAVLLQPRRAQIEVADDEALGVARALYRPAAAPSGWVTRRTPVRRSYSSMRIAHSSSARTSVSNEVRTRSANCSWRSWLWNVGMRRSRSSETDVFCGVVSRGSLMTRPGTPRLGGAEPLANRNDSQPPSARNWQQVVARRHWSRRSRSARRRWRRRCRSGFSQSASVGDRPRSTARSATASAAPRHSGGTSWATSDRPPVLSDARLSLLRTRSYARHAPAFEQTTAGVLPQLIGAQRGRILAAMGRTLKCRFPCNDLQ